MSEPTYRETIGRELLITGDQLNRLILRAPHSYKVYTIPKRTKGRRVIAQPAKETKIIQKWLIRNIFKDLPQHESAVAYKLGSSIKKNAQIHRRNKYMLKMDFQSFFTSIKMADLVKHFQLYIGEKYSESEIVDFARISCIQLRGDRQLCLSIGAPSSPMLSNSILYKFDSLLSSWCKANRVTYTRYADDLTFSTNQQAISSSIEAEVRKAVKDIGFPTLKVNHGKTIHLSKKHQRRVTGLVITNDNKISLGRDRKREIRSLIHHSKSGSLDEGEVYRLQGLIGFAIDVEPEFISRMNKKYGGETVKEILRKRKVDKD